MVRLHENMEAGENMELTHQSLTALQPAVWLLLAPQVHTGAECLLGAPAIVGRATSRQVLRRALKGRWESECRAAVICDNAAHPDPPVAARHTGAPAYLLIVLTLLLMCAQSRHRVMSP